MDGFLRQSTAATLKIGKYVDDTDGVTVENALVIAQADVRLSKNGGNMAQKNDATACTVDEGGWYDCPVNTTDTNTLGLLMLDATVAGACPVYHKYMVVTANIFDTFFSTDAFDVEVTTKTGFALSAAGVDAIWDEDATTHTTADTTSERLNAVNDMLTGKMTIVGTTMTHYKQDGVTARKTFTLDSSTAATSRTP